MSHLRVLAIVFLSRPASHPAEASQAEGLALVLVLGVSAPPSTFGSQGRDTAKTAELDNLLEMWD
jgi:hypothetical protein